MSSTRWFAQYVSPEVTKCGRRSSLNQLDILNQLSKPPSSLLSPHSKSSGHHQSETCLVTAGNDDKINLFVERKGLFTCTPSEHNSNNFWRSTSPLVHNSNCRSRSEAPVTEEKDEAPSFDHGTENKKKTLQVRRSSCSPCLMSSALPIQQNKTMLRRSSLVSFGAARASTSLLPDPCTKRRRSFCTSSPLYDNAVEGSTSRSEFVSRLPSLSPCVEDENKEEKFLFCSDGGSGSSCSPFLHNQHFSNLFSKSLAAAEDCTDVNNHVFTSPTLNNKKILQENSANSTHCRFSGFDVRNKSDNIPSIIVNKASPENTVENTALHEGFSLWLVNHIQECRSSSGLAESRPPRTPDGGEDKELRVCDGQPAPHHHLQPQQRLSLRRVSLQGLQLSGPSLARRTSLHLPRARPLVVVCPPEPPSHRRVPLGAVIGRGGFGTVHVGKYKGELVAVKKMKARKAQSCLSSELSGLRVPSHPHLVTSIAVAIATARGTARLTHRDDHLVENEEKEMTMKSMKRRFGFLSESRSKNYCSKNQVEGDFFNTRNRSLRILTNNKRLEIRDLNCAADDPILDSSEAAYGCYERRSPEGGNESNWLWVISELCSSTTLLSLIHSSKEISIKQKIRYLGELASGLSFLHERGFVHRDVKPANLFLTTNGTLKLGDYGCLGDPAKDMMPVVGTIQYQAPEILQGSVGGCYSDVYSYGVTAWHLLQRDLPYQGLHPHVVAYNVTRVGLRPDSSGRAGKLVDHKTLSSSHAGGILAALVTTLARKCWQQDLHQRPSSSSLCRTMAILYLTPYTPLTK